VGPRSKASLGGNRGPEEALTGRSAINLWEFEDRGLSEGIANESRRRVIWKSAG
jgi:hypothetical protein